MCTHQRFVFNQYTHTSFLVKCGKCPACLQEKAYKRAFRIKQECTSDRLTLFVTLTYDRCSCPYVLKTDIDNRVDVLPVYREITTRRSRVHTKSGLKYLDRRKYNRVVLDYVYNPDYYSLSKRVKLRSLAYRPYHIGICYYPDVQLFKKRLNINLKRLYNYEKIYKIYSCSEYGERSQRPHFHLAVSIPKDDEALFRLAISQAWPFASHRRTEKYIEIARDAANYLASYVNCGTHLHSFLTTNFKTKHSYSKDYGMASQLFSLDSVLSKIEQRDLSFLRPIGPRGKETYVNFSIPKFVLNRYFPVFKGYSRFTDVEVLDVLRSFIQCGTKQAKTPLISLSKLLSIDYNKDDLHKISVRLTNSFINFCNYKNWLPTEQCKEDYIRYHQNCWKVYNLTNMRLWYEDDSVDPKYKYNNTQALRGGLISSPDTFIYLNSTPSDFIDNPNEYPQNVQLTDDYTRIYNFRCKEKKVNNFIMAQNNYYF